MKSERKKLVDKLDKAVSAYVRSRDKACVTCGSTERLGCGHIFSRVAHSTRWDISEQGNCWCQCWGCNYRHEFDPYPYFTWYEKKFGKEALEELHQKFKTPHKYKDFELQEMLDNIKSMT
jgi:hypothetical protein